MSQVAKPRRCLHGLSRPRAPWLCTLLRCVEKASFPWRVPPGGGSAVSRPSSTPCNMGRGLASEPTARLLAPALDGAWGDPRGQIDGGDRARAGQDETPVRRRAPHSGACVAPGAGVYQAWGAPVARLALSVSGNDRPGMGWYVCAEDAPSQMCRMTTRAPSRRSIFPSHAPAASSILDGLATARRHGGTENTRSTTKEPAMKLTPLSSSALCLTAASVRAQTSRMPRSRRSS